MRKKSRVLVRTLALAGLVGAASSLAVMPDAFAITSHKTLNDTRAVGATPVHVDFPIEYFGLVADLKSPTSHLSPHGRAPYGEARFHVRGHWTSWRALEQDGAQAPGHFTAALLDVDRADAYQVRGLPTAGHHWRAAAINTTDGPSIVVGHGSDAANAAPACMSRADWGADESITAWSSGQAQSFAPAQVITVHHTAGSNDLNQDYAKTVRAIYDYHVQTNGWADIGYQYLIDGHGVVYEGRNSGHVSKSCLHDGGDGSDFAHQTDTDDIVTGAHTENNNTGNIGISMMGCFEPGSSTCTGNVQPTAAAMTSLKSLVASLAARHHIDPDSTVTYANPNGSRSIPAVSGHRDWEATACPGGNLYALLPDVRHSTIAFRQASRTVAENAGTVQVPVTRTGNTALPATVDYAVTGGTATSGTDDTVSSGTLSFAAGETTKSVPVSITDDSTPEGRETVQLALSNPGADAVLGTQSTTTLAIAASDQQPDALVSTASSLGYVGNNVYNTTGSHQTKTVSARRTATRTFYVRISNDGNVKDTLHVFGSAARSGSTVRYFSGTTDITSALRSTAGWKRTLDPGAYALVKVRIAVGGGAGIGTLKPARVRGVWTGDGTRADLVAGVVKVVS